MEQPGKVADHGQYSWTEQELVTGEAVALDVRAASIILRAAGTIIDYVAYILLFLGVAFLVAGLTGVAIDDALGRALGIAGLVVCLLIVPMAVETASGGRSLGKLAIGARIVRDDGGAIQLRHAFIRALLGIIEIYLTFGGIAATTALLNSKSKRLGDLLAGTYSQHERVPRLTDRTVPLPPVLEAWAQTVDIVRLPDRLSRRIAQFLRQADKLTPATRLRLADSLATEAVPFVSPKPEVSAEVPAQVSAEVFLAGVAAVRRSREFTALKLEQERLDRLQSILHSLPHGFPQR
ncbi:RDD family protein [Cryobacterium sp. TMT1-19]|uniref:RDD family protein n=1 Tax=Cryobacterium sp. TMT1-19 TaxID=1259231 RepID=UPI001069E175|nr:RDD family protein [Cryobacterium sp. TMT1-19]TFD32336.1 RDD family protein [Cryobacterium sp. TMT1-19]